MPQSEKPAAAAKRRGTHGRDADAVLKTANGFIVQHFPFGCLGKDPQRLVGPEELWVVSVALTSPGYGEVGEVGMVAVDSRTLQVTAATDRQKVNRAVEQLKVSKHDELEAAFLRARTV
jgi:hypothetical protein